MKVSEVMTRDVQTVRPDQTGAAKPPLHAERRRGRDPGH